MTNGEAIDNFVAGTITYSPNNLNQLLNSTDSTSTKTYLYDDDGNMTTGYTPEGYALTMTYDAENRMKTAEYTDGGSVVHRTEYYYGGDSLLAEMKKYENGILISDTRDVRAGFLPVQVRNENSVLVREYSWGLNYGGGIGGLLGLKQSGTDYSYLYDGKGNVSALIDSTQNLVAAYAYDPFGQLMKKSGTFDQPYTFSTKEAQTGTGQYYYGFRFYDSCSGKWTTRDPLGEESDIDLYRIAGNNPVNNIDPLGLDAMTGLLIDLKKMRNLESLIDDMGALNAMPYFAFGIGAVTKVSACKGVRFSLGNETFSLSTHAIKRMVERGINLSAVKSAMNNPSFRYFHEGVWKTGYYDSASKVFIGLYGNEVRTVMRAKQNYINNLLKAGGF